MAKPTPPDSPEAGLHRALKSAMAHSRIQRSQGRTGKATAKLAGVPKKPKGKKGKRVMSNGLTIAEQRRVDELVPKATQQHGDYAPVAFKLQEVTEGGRRVEKTQHVVMNRGGTAIERWHRRGRLDDRQMAAIAMYERNYRAFYGMPPRVVANWSAVVTRMLQAAVEMSSNARIDARQMLRLFDQDIFFRRGLADFNVWQNVVIHDEPAGIAGSRLGFTRKEAAETAAQVIVGSIAHEIAALCIDSQPPDLESLLLDIDAPRKQRHG